MKAHAHTVLGCAAWLGCCAAARAAGWDVPDSAVVAGTAVAGGWAEWPDIDTGSTPAASLGIVTMLPARLIEWLAGHRGATHWAVTTAGLSGLLAGCAALGEPYGGAAVRAAVFLGLVWCEAGFAADDRRSRRLGAVARGLVCLLGTSLAVSYAGLWWVPFAVLVGGWAHLAGDCLTRSRYRMLAPFTWRPVGGAGVIPPVGRGRVSHRERALDITCWLAVLTGLYLLTADGLSILLVTVATLAAARWTARRVRPRALTRR